MEKDFEVIWRHKFINLLMEILATYKENSASYSLINSLIENFRILYENIEMFSEEPFKFPYIEKLLKNQPEGRREQILALKENMKSIFSIMQGVKELKSNIDSLKSDLKHKDQLNNDLEDKQKLLVKELKSNIDGLKSDLKHKDQLNNDLEDKQKLLDVKFAQDENVIAKYEKRIEELTLENKYLQDKEVKELKLQVDILKAELKSKDQLNSDKMEEQKLLNMELIASKNVIHSCEKRLEALTLHNKYLQDKEVKSLKLQVNDLKCDLKYNVKLNKDLEDRQKQLKVKIAQDGHVIGKYEKRIDELALENKYLQDKQIKELKHQVDALKSELKWKEKFNNDLKEEQKLLNEQVADAKYVIHSYENKIETLTFQIKYLQDKEVKELKLRVDGLQTELKAKDQFHSDLILKQKLLNLQFEEAKNVIKNYEIKIATLSIQNKYLQENELKELKLQVDVLTTGLESKNRLNSELNEGQKLLNVQLAEAKNFIHNYENTIKAVTFQNSYLQNQFHFEKEQYIANAQNSFSIINMKLLECARQRDAFRLKFESINKKFNLNEECTQNVLNQMRTKLNNCETEKTALIQEVEALKLKLKEAADITHASEDDTLSLDLLKQDMIKTADKERKKLLYEMQSIENKYLKQQVTLNVSYIENARLKRELEIQKEIRKKQEQDFDIQNHLLQYKIINRKKF